MTGILTPEEIKNVVDKGDLLGSSLPNPHAKGMWWDVYLYKKNLFAVVMPNATQSDYLAKSISYNDMLDYVEDIILARKLYHSFLTPHEKAV